MKKTALGFCGLLSVLVLNTTVQAAPINYRFEPNMHVEFQGLPGGSLTLIGLNGPLIPASTALSLTFTYDSGVAVTPRDLPPNSADVIYADMFDAAGAFTNIVGALDDYRFTAADVNSMSFSYMTPNIFPGDTVYGRVGALGKTVGDDGTDFTGVLSGQNFRLANISLTFGGDPVSSGALPSHLSLYGGGSSQVQLGFIGDDGMVVQAAYFGVLTEVPLPGAFWLFGSSLLAPIALRRRNKK
jgi:hypothetical protein